MASVSSTSDNNYAYYQKAMSDLSDENRSDKKRSEESEKNRISALEENSATDRQNANNEHEETIKNIRENYNQAFKSERDQNREERETLKKNLTYDSAGRLQNDEVRIQNQKIQGEHEREVSRLRKSFDESEDGLRSRSTENLQEIKKDFAEQSGNLAKTNDDRMSQLKRQNAEVESTLSVQNKKEKDQSDAHLNSVVERESQSRKEALAAQTKTYQATAARNDADNKDQIKELKGQIAGTQNGTSPRPLSPLAYNKVRNDFLKEYQQKMDAQDLQHQGQIVGVEDHANRLKEEVFTESQTREQSRHQEDLANQLRERNEFKFHTEQIVDSTEHRLHEQDAGFKRTAMLQDRNRQYASDETKRKFDETIDAGRMDSQIRINALKQDHDIQMRAQQRESNTRYSEAIRGYEKQLTDQKASYEALMQEQKAQLDSTLRDVERRHRAESETQNRLFEARMSENESIAREREKTVANQHQDELEKVRNFHAQQLKKKS